ncbi:hypothetical protein CEUSTIGMA_g4143.t1 [Chlamydomonas eustigma]|uniref:Uncharacterized protein n=1 Tax=Chlamydomonas eustigma TaxID=1157962 RepID=A0A250X0U5_9CHLO|nr:hypothetical protein CEUSTIGMA_g4143.t1 [Chlamydomonas eustigma]|eukprot:GAX76697.1 hypothetical protein CEUSTIGMA_g4143.t1 [Chlamydomonas eustigma]
MANSTLFRSSIVMTVAHAFSILLSRGNNPVLIWVYGVGCLTSLLNHGFHKQNFGHLELLRTVDRLWMVLGTLVDVHTITHLHTFQERAACVCAVTIYAAFFALAKVLVSSGGKESMSSNLPHLATHLCATCLHVWLLIA